MGKKEVNIDWMLSCNNPTPLEFFRRILPTHRSRAFDKYDKTLDQAINCCKDPEKQSTLKKVKEIMYVIEYILLKYIRKAVLTSVFH